MISKPKLVIVAVAVVIVLLLIVGGGTVFASNRVEPGDLLFSVDKASESVRRIFILTPVRKVEYEMDVLDERVAELEDVSEDNINLCLNEIEEQQERIQTRVEEMAENSEIGAGEKERIRTRLETQAEDHLQLMERLRVRLENEGNENAAENIENANENYQKGNDDTLENFEQEQNEEQEQNQGEDTQNQEQNEQNEQNQDGDGKNE